METISFARGVPSPDCIPVDELAECARAALARDGRTILSYGSAAGYGPLREWIADHHGVATERVVVTNGSLQGLAFLAGHLIGSGSRRVLVEAPTYDRTLKVLGRLDAEVVAVPVDEEGLDVDALERAIDTGPAPLLYTIPTFQNPSGRTLSRERRVRLADLARERHVLVLEDDPYSLVRFDGEPLPSVFVLSGGEGVAYASSFSKTVAPGLRVGYLILPADLARAVEALAVSTYITPVLLSQATVDEFLRRGRLEPNLERVRSLLRARRDAMLAALEQHFPSPSRWSRPEGGYFVWLELSEAVAAAALVEPARKAGVTFVPGVDFYPAGGGGEHAARLAYSFVTPDAIRDGVARLSRIVESAGRGAPAELIG